MKKIQCKLYLHEQIRQALQIKKKSQLSNCINNGHIEGGVRPPHFFVTWHPL